MVGADEVDQTVRYPWIQTDRVISEKWSTRLGTTLAADGDLAIVGSQPSRSWDLDIANGHDRVYVFERATSGTWQQTAMIVPEDARRGDTFGYSVALDAQEPIFVAGNPAAGQVHVFERTPTGAWNETVRLTGATDGFGYDVAVDSGTILVSGFDWGVHVFEREDGTWKASGEPLPAVGPLDIEGEVAIAKTQDSWPSLAILGKRVGVWQPLDDGLLPNPGSGSNHVATSADLRADGSAVVVGSAIDQRVVASELHGQRMAAVGSAWVYEKVDGHWELTADLLNPDPGPFEAFGDAVIIKGDTLVVGATLDSHNGAERAGAAYVYQKRDNGWEIKQKLRNTDNGPYGGGDKFGASLAFADETLLVGAPSDGQRRDGMPHPLDDDGDIPPCIHPDIYMGCDNGEQAGSVYAFEPVNQLVPLER